MSRPATFIETTTVEEIIDEKHEEPSMYNPNLDPLKMQPSGTAPRSRIDYPHQLIDKPTYMPYTPMTTDTPTSMPDTPASITNDIVERPIPEKYSKYATGLKLANRYLIKLYKKCSSPDSTIPQPLIEFLHDLSDRQVRLLNTFIEEEEGTNPLMEILAEIDNIKSSFDDIEDLSLIEQMDGWINYNQVMMILKAEMFGEVIKID